MACVEYAGDFPFCLFNPVTSVFSLYGNGTKLKTKYRRIKASVRVSTFLMFRNIDSFFFFWHMLTVIRGNGKEVPEGGN